MQRQYKGLWTVGDEVLSFELARPNGNSGGFQIMIGGFYCGQIVHYSTGWTVCPNTPEITGDDAMIMLEMIGAD